MALKDEPQQHSGLPPEGEIPVERSYTARSSTKNLLSEQSISFESGRKEIKEAIKTGEIKKLIDTVRGLRKKHGYFPNIEVSAIRGAAENGDLFKLLEAVSDLPLSQLPVVARENVKLYGRHLDLKKEKEDEALKTDPLIRASDDGSDDPSEVGLHVLLSNYITVPGPAAEEMLDEVVEEVIIEGAEPGDKKAPQHEAAPYFPKELGPLFFKRWHLDATYLKDKKQLLIDGMLYDVSPLEAVTLGEEARRVSKIPQKAQKFAFVYCGPAIPTGAFVYLDENQDIICANVLDANHLPNAYAFGEGEKMSDETRKRLTSLEQQGWRPHTVTIRALRDKGVQQYAWVGPAKHQELGLKPSADGNYKGGFAYFFLHEDYNRFFPLESVIKLNDGAILQWTMNAAVLGQEPSHAEFTRSLLRPCESKCFNFGMGQRCSSTVKLFRVTVPDVIHPVVINALAKTPRQEALCTSAAEAIIMATWPRVELQYYVDFLCLLVDAMTLFWLTRDQVSPLISENQGYTIMGTGSTQGAFLWEGGPHVSCLPLACTIVKKVCEDLVCFLEWRKMGPLSVYVDSRKAGVLLFRWTGTLLLVLTVACELVADDVIQLLPRRVILAFAGLMRWIDVVIHFRGLQSWGPSILPILNVFSDVLGFLVVMAFMVIGFAHAFYALTQAGGSTVLLNTWRLGVLGDFALPEIVFDQADVVGGETGLDAPKHPGFALLVFVLCSFIITVVLTNIFIGIVSSSYDTHADRAVQLFLQSRASMCVDYMLIRRRIRSCCGRRDRDQPLLEPQKFVWFCQSAAETEGSVGSFEGSITHVVRTEMAELKGKIQKDSDTNGDRDRAEKFSTAVEIAELKGKIQKDSDTNGDRDRAEIVSTAVEIAELKGKIQKDLDTNEDRAEIVATEAKQKKQRRRQPQPGQEPTSGQAAEPKRASVAGRASADRGEKGTSMEKAASAPVASESNLVDDGGTLE